MKRDAWIEIQGIARQGRHKDVTEMSTKGSYCLKNGSAYICYDELEESGLGKAKTVLKVEGDRQVTLTRSGGGRSQLMLEKGVRHLCCYGLEYGQVHLGVFTKHIQSQLGEDGGQVEFAYSLDVNAGLLSENEVKIRVKCQ